MVLLVWGKLAPFIKSSPILPLAKQCYIDDPVLTFYVPPISIYLIQPFRPHIHSLNSWFVPNLVRRVCLADSAYRTSGWGLSTTGICKSACDYCNSLRTRRSRR
ncbi:hypothetical protein JTE90_026533 [Oedothorax gibbosus]|uniref:Uncharacterized protein n=1 Tax=Oedothorax gibbosus TaxID=931172 RepID=A0AAV6VPK5_9ARAC|nr:hypothetical protein JTE90_026533 [Oedothorax gibbosus]